MVNIQPIIELSGLGFPAQKIPGYFKPKVRVDVAWSDLLIALFIPRGSRVMRRTVGSRLRDLLFRAVTTDFLDGASIEFTVREVAQMQTPHVRIHNVEVSKTPGVNGKSIDLDITFSLAVDNFATVTKTVSVNKTTVTAV